jgi:hypothetical protein
MKVEGEIKYIGFYDIPREHDKRVANIAAVNKMDYICDAIIRAGFTVQIISPSWLDELDRSSVYVPQTKLQLSDKKYITFCPSFRTKGKWSRNLKIVFTLVWLFFWLIKHVNKNEKILVYHVQWLSLPIRWAKRIKKFNLILEVEEIYGQVWENKRILRKWEQRLIRDANYFIAVSDILAEILGERVKVILYGNYNVSRLRKSSSINDKINVVYAGSIDSTKGGAENSVRCIEFLPEDYVIHILGSGNIHSVEKLVNVIDQINRKLGRESCIYHGLKIGYAFDEIMSNFSIGINPQFDGAYMSTAFPSKIIKYLSYNLRVVSTRIKSVDKSDIASFITFAENDTPESIALAIKQIDLYSKFDGKEVLDRLDRNFVLDIKNLFD